MLQQPCGLTVPKPLTQIVSANVLTDVCMYPLLGNRPHARKLHSRVAHLFCSSTFSTELSSGTSYKHSLTRSRKGIARQSIPIIRKCEQNGPETARRLDTMGLPTARQQVARTQLFLLSPFLESLPLAGARHDFVKLKRCNGYREPRTRLTT